MKQRFRLSKNDTVKGTLVGWDGKLLASVYDSGFTTKESVYNALCRKVPHYGGHIVQCTISTEDGKYTRFTKKVNR